jgi:hypothetical protein
MALHGKGRRSPMIAKVTMETAQNDRNGLTLSLLFGSIAGTLMLFSGHRGRHEKPGWLRE